jgi:RNA polymerase sigma-70 factor (ECF subfamily)
MPSDQPMTKDWMESFRKGDIRSFRKMFDLYFDRMSYFAFKLVNNQAEAEEIASESLAKLMKLHQNYATEADARAFLYVTVKNHCYDIFRMRSRHMDMTESMENESIVDQDEIVINRIIQTEVIHSIHQEIEKLPVQRREILKLFFIDDLKIEEIAAQMGLHPDNVRSTKAKALVQLRGFLSHKHVFSVVSCLLAKQWFQTDNVD